MDELEFYNGLYTGQQIDDGLGRTAFSKKLTNADTLSEITSPGNYYWEAQSASPSDVPFAYGFMQVYARGTVTIYQICYNTTGMVVNRNIYVGTISPWYWVAGCPMVDGVEYATAEKFNNKVVYCQMKSVGNVTANTVSTVVFASGLSASGRIIRSSVHGIKATNTNNVLTAPFDDGTTTIKANGYYYGSSNVWSARIGILSNSNLTNVYATAWYTKD